MITRARLRFERDFVQVPNAWMRDKRLSHRARGILAEVMTHSEGWVVTVESLVDNGTEGREAVRTAIAELVEHGYLQRQVKRADGRLAGSMYVLTDPDQSDGFLGGQVSGAPESRASGNPSTKNTILEEHQGENTSAPLALVPEPAPAEPDGWAEFWKMYPRHSGASAAVVQRKWKVATLRAGPGAVMAGLQRWVRYWEAEHTAAKHIPMATTWLNQERWAAELDDQATTGQSAGEWWAQ